MDPLSIISGVITITSALAFSLDKAKRFYDAPAEIDMLINEVSDFRILIQELDSGITERLRVSSRTSEGDGVVQSLVAHLKIAQGRLQSLDSKIASMMSSPRTSNQRRKISRWAWMRQIQKIKTLAAELRRSRLTLMGLAEAAQILESSKIHVKLDEIVLLNRRQNDKLPDQDRLLQQLQQYLNLNTARQTEHESRRGIGNTSSASQQSNSSSRLPTVSSRRRDNLQQSQSEARDYLIPRHMTISNSSTNGEEELGYCAVRVRTSTYRVTPCSDWCGCQCHKSSNFQTPKLLESILGRMFVGYSGLPVMRPICDERTCRKQSIPTIKISYHFPTWFLSRALHSSLSFNYMNGPQLTLRMPRVVDGGADILTFAVQGDIARIKSLFRRGVASPYDVACTNGRSALHYAVNNQHLELAQFLVDSGADATMEDKDYTSTISIAWRAILGKLSDRQTIDAWRSIFNSEDYLESRCFPILHKIILNLSNLDLRMQLEQSTATIDATDAEGRTALSWAAMRGSLDDVRILLEFGADPNLACPKRQAPLHWATQTYATNQEFDVVQALLDGGGRPNAQDAWHRTPLLYASPNYDSPESLSLLIDAGSDMNVRDCHQRTPLGYAVRMGKVRNAERLVESGANVDIPDMFGITPLLEAVQQNQTSLINLLLRHGARQDRKTKLGMNILHIAATHGNGTTMQCLRQGLSVRFSDKAGYQGIMIGHFKQRDDITLELEESFQSLLRECTIGISDSSQAENGTIVVNTSNLDEIDEFFDAQEYL